MQKRVEDLTHAFTICALDPPGTPGRIWRKSLDNRTCLPPKRKSVPVKSRRVRSTASIQYLSHITISYRKSKSMFFISSSNVELGELLHVLSDRIGVGILKVECTVLSPSRKTAATADVETGKTFLARMVSTLCIALVRKVFPVSSGSSSKKTRELGAAELPAIGESGGVGRPRKLWTDTPGRMEPTIRLNAFVWPSLKSLGAYQSRFSKNVRAHMARVRRWPFVQPRKFVHWLWQVAVRESVMSHGLQRVPHL